MMAGRQGAGSSCAANAAQKKVQSMQQRVVTGCWALGESHKRRESYLIIGFNSFNI
jgi:hypothetical protein